jgi:putative endonuclease
MERIYYVYILASKSRVLYVGVTNNIERRLAEHRGGNSRKFAFRYRTFRLVYLEAFGDVRDAIAREKDIKTWRREKKMRLIEWKNLTWEDLAERRKTRAKG